MAGKKVKPRSKTKVRVQESALPDKRQAGAGRHPQGRLALSWRCGAQDLARRRAAFPGPYHPSSGARSARRQNPAGRRQHRPSGPHHLPLHRFRQELEGSHAPARLRQGAGRAKRPQRQSHLLAHPGARATNPTSGMPAPRRKACSAARMAASPGTTFSGLNDDPQYRAWMGSEQDGTPDGPKLHSIIVDPRDPKHLYFAMSSGGVHETRDGGKHWAPLVEGLEVVEGFDAKNLAFHDPHCVRLCPSNPDRLYQQNHCGIYRLDRPSKTGSASARPCPNKIGDVGFPMVVHPRDDDTRLGVADGRPDGVAAHQHRRQALRLWHAQRRQKLDSGWTRACPRPRPGGR